LRWRICFFIALIVFLQAISFACSSSLPIAMSELSSLAAKREQLLELLRSFESCVVALSAGVDSAVVAKAAFLALGERSLAVTGTSHSLASGELEAARALAQQIGMRHETIATGEFEQPAYLQNAPDRCYHCKTELYTQLEGLAEKFGMNVTVNGVNVDDLGDYRPGLQAASEHEVRSPLAECGINKSEVRQLAADWGLPVWDKPASPCLSSRVAYGEEVTPERLEKIDRAEQYLRELGLRTVRVRYHRGDLARIEVPAESLALLASESTRQALAARFRELGFKFVTLDLEGFRSGSLNDLVPLEILGRH
jgi:pyridinium-3,5-biscarboxylic acid mononucleotide sulfurtransferase